MVKETGEDAKKSKDTGEVVPHSLLSKLESNSIGTEMRAVGRRNSAEVDLKIDLNNLGILCRHNTFGRGPNDVIEENTDKGKWSFYYIYDNSFLRNGGFTMLAYLVVICLLSKFLYKF